MVIPQSTRQFRNGVEGKRLFELIGAFPDVQSVEMTSEIKQIIDLVISIIIVKKGWMDPKEKQGKGNDLIQDIYMSFMGQLQKNGVYRDKGGILRNIWLRMHSEVPIDNLYSYLCRAVQNRCWDFWRREAKHTDYYEDIVSKIDKMQEYDELVDHHIPQVLTQVYEDEFFIEFNRNLDNIVFRLIGRELVACHWLVRKFKKGRAITPWDLWMFPDIFPDRQIFIYQYVDTKIRMALHHMKDLKDMRGVRLF